MLQTSITTRSGFTAFTNCAKPAGVVTLAWKRCRPVSPSYSQPTVLYFPKSNAKIFITGYSLLSQILSQPEKAKLVMVVTLSNFQIDFGRPGFIVSGTQAPGSHAKQNKPRAREAGESPLEKITLLFVGRL